MLHNEARNLQVKAYEKPHDAKAVALAYGVSVPTVYRPAEQKAKTGNVGLRVSERGRKRVLAPEDSERIAKAIAGQPDITLSEIVEKLTLPVGIETVRRRIQAMGYRRKKKMIHASEQQRPRCAPGENHGVGLRRQHRLPVWFSWMKAESISIWPDGMAGEKGAAGGRSRAAEYTKIRGHVVLDSSG